VNSEVEDSESSSEWRLICHSVPVL